MSLKIDLPPPCPSRLGTWMSGIARPVERKPQSLFERDRRLVAEQRLRLGNIGLGIVDVPGARILIYRLEIGSDDLVQRAQQLVERDAQPGRDVDDFAR